MSLLAEGAPCWEEVNASLIDCVKKLGAALKDGGAANALEEDEEGAFWKGSITSLLFPLAELFSPFSTFPFPTTALLLP